MLKELKEVRLVFENCESASVPRSEIWTYAIADIHSFHRSANTTEGYNGLKATKFYIIFNDLENLKYTGFSDEVSKSLFERVTKFSDITHIDVIYEDDTTFYISVPWGSGDQYHNAFQILRKLKSGRYEIEIQEGWNIIKLCRYIKHRLNGIKWQITWRYRKYLKHDDSIWW